MSYLTSFQFEPLCPHNDKSHLHQINKLSEEKNNQQQIFKDSGLVLKSSFHNPNNEFCHEESCLYLKNEYMILQVLRHPNIVRAFEFYDTFQVMNPYKQCCMVLEKGQMDLQMYLHNKVVKLSQIKSIFKEIAQGLQYIHEQGYAHNDIKCSNILVFKNELNQLEIKIADFEMARIMNFFNNGSDQRMYWYNRNLEYASPELAQQQRSKQQHIDIVDEQKADVFAFGIILFKIIFGQIPFSKNQKDGVSKNDQMYKCLVKQQHNRFWNRSFIQHKMQAYQELDQNNIINFELPKDLIENLLNYNPNERYTMTQALQHPWFNL